MSKASWDSRDDEADGDCEEGADDDNDAGDKDEEDDGHAAQQKRYMLNKPPRFTQGQGGIGGVCGGAEMLDKDEEDDHAFQHTSALRQGKCSAFRPFSPSTLHPF